ncbi:glutamine-hydrolyzing carbamoyl-phosphate synthase small subunit [Shewanella schlegeliana]|uniref:Carbamoyl phosphate synthase small chain n=1 Tax=Shewanella schlegeliana TaxID=190308 RepID=A0ABS1T015_9GAMM|nr:glutamine-hydrolyzing carbamoyl-phosphate synthase small subunit [Shewanella schlegeliana]MBL4913610.1 glutamine-hydrolyzing carbamoyl-phosphate synthase small subunit [Shewanella schlegeliana]MCL1108501.1 glutamine-hydrolyzing carbamoyl-phosphate synthase small subunit [Shewanella schlegeliana]
MIWLFPEVALTKSALLVLEDGTIFSGTAIGAEGMSVGEVVFNTSMTGYQEILTDPSYSRQMVTLTYPHIGNTGTNEEDTESDSVHACGLIIRDLPLIASNFRNQQSLSDYLIAHNVVGIADIDTRKLTRILREKGAQAGCIMVGDLDEAKALAAAKAFPGLKGMDLAKEVTTNETYSWRSGSWRLVGGLPSDTPEAELKYKVVAYDYGVKRNILRMLVDRGCDVTVVPAQTPAAEVLAMNPDGVFLSNGPGDPEPCDYAIAAIQEILKTDIPVFGICLGHQLLALASGAKTLKMKFGHHGANHPVSNIEQGNVMITSQNHGFAADETTLPANIKVTHKSLFDGSLQGIHLTDKPAFSFQGHPEASPGPHDAAPLFNHFIDLIELYRKNAK